MLEGWPTKYMYIISTLNRYDSPFINYHPVKLIPASSTFDIQCYEIFEYYSKNSFAVFFVSNVMVRKRYLTFQLQWSLSSDYILKFLSVMLSTLPLDYYISCRNEALWVRFSIIRVPKDIVIFFWISRD